MTMPPVMRVQSVSKTWPVPGRSPLTVLNGLNLDIHAGESVAIIGPSGSGKSTLLSLLAGLDRPSAGQIQIMGHDIALMNESELAIFRGQKIGIVFQQFHLMPSLTALENVALPLQITQVSDATEKARTALQRVGLSERMTHLPREHSGGECQRVAIARALVVQPAVLLADEPSGNLDPETGAQITDLVFDMARRNKTTMVLVTHNMDLAARCDRQFVMQRGVLTVRGH